MVTALNVFSTPSESSFCKAFGAIGASVKTKDSMVAMSGAIMPAPLAIPQIVTVALPSFAPAVAVFGNVSVVMMARAASRKRPGSAFATMPSSTPSNLPASSGSPITPVEATKTSAGLQPIAFAASSVVKRTCALPFLPVNAFALPELTTSPAALPRFTCFRHHSTGAEGHFERVNTPATAVPLSKAASRTSVRPRYLMPADPVASRTPSIAGGSTNSFGASGDTVVLIFVLSRPLYHNGREIFPAIASTEIGAAYNYFFLGSALAEAASALLS